MHSVKNIIYTRSYATCCRILEVTAMMDPITA